MGKKPHALILPFPMQSHINSFLNLSKLLHHRGFRITFVNTEFIHTRLLQTMGPDSLNAVPDFSFRTIPDGLKNSTEKRETSAVWESIGKTCFNPLCDVIKGCDSAVTCVISDVIMSFTLGIRDVYGIPVVFYSPISATSLLILSQLSTLQSKGIIPVKDATEMDRELDWIPGIKSARVKDVWEYPIDPANKIVELSIKELRYLKEADAVAINTFHELEENSIKALSSFLPRIYPIGPLPLFLNQIPNPTLKTIKCNLWKEEEENEYACLQWLDTKEKGSVLYINYGSNVILSEEQMNEFAWGVANSRRPFLWVMRPEMATKEGVLDSSEFLNNTKGRGMVMRGWCRQDKVLKHDSIGGFLTHCGWNSMSESICEGVGMVCWPCGGDQFSNCRWACVEWGVGLEVCGGKNVKREEVEKVVVELMVGDKGTKIKENVTKLRNSASISTSSCGSSFQYLNNLIDGVLLRHV